MAWSGPECAVLVEDWCHPTPCVDCAGLVGPELDKPGLVWLAAKDGADVGRPRDGGGSDNMVSEDRTVHGISPAGREIVRYERAGQWYLEGKGERRTRITLHYAAGFASEGQWFEGLPGGLQLDAKVRSMRANPRVAS